jgi:hypothetical protein
VSHGRNLRIILALSVTTLVVSLAPSAQAATTVCNEAGNGHRGDLVASGTPDPQPVPARHTTDLGQLGSGNGKGLVRAAERSPALTACVLPGDDGDIGPPLGGGGGTV